jgi:hypothetical protein
MTDPTILVHAVDDFERRTGERIVTLETEPSVSDLEARALRVALRLGGRSVTTDWTEAQWQAVKRSQLADWTGDDLREKIRDYRQELARRGEPLE